MFQISVFMEVSNCNKNIPLCLDVSDAKSHADLSSTTFEVHYSINNNTLKESPCKQALSVLLHYLF